MLILNTTIVKIEGKVKDLPTVYLLAKLDWTEKKYLLLS